VVRDRSGFRASNKNAGFGLERPSTRAFDLGNEIIAMIGWHGSPLRSDTNNLARERRCMEGASGAIIVIPRLADNDS
jgi:hypothetical protein